MTASFVARYDMGMTTTAAQIETAVRKYSPSMNDADVTWMVTYVSNLITGDDISLADAIYNAAEALDDLS